MWSVVIARVTLQSCTQGQIDKAYMVLEVRFVASIVSSSVLLSDVTQYVENLFFVVLPKQLY